MQNISFKKDLDVLVENNIITVRQAQEIANLFLLDRDNRGIFLLGEGTYWNLYDSERDLLVSVLGSPTAIIVKYLGLLDLPDFKKIYHEESLFSNCFYPSDKINIKILKIFKNKKLGSLEELEALINSSQVNKLEVKKNLITLFYATHPKNVAKNSTSADIVSALGQQHIREKIAEFALDPEPETLKSENDGKNNQNTSSKNKFRCSVM